LFLEQEAELIPERAGRFEEEKISKLSKKE
jgi:hypothetical protein